MGVETIPRRRKRRSHEPSTRHYRADEGTCLLLSLALGISEEATQEAFLGEPTKMVEAIALWSLGRKAKLAKQEGQSYADRHWNHAEEIITWAQTRKRGAYNTRPNLVRDKVYLSG